MGKRGRVASQWLINLAMSDYEESIDSFEEAEGVEETYPLKEELEKPVEREERRSRITARASSKVLGSLPLQLFFSLSSMA